MENHKYLEEGHNISRRDFIKTTSMALLSTLFVEQQDPVIKVFEEVNLMGKSLHDSIYYMYDHPTLKPLIEKFINDNKTDLTIYEHNTDSEIDRKILYLTHFCLEYNYYLNRNSEGSKNLLLQKIESIQTSDISKNTKMLEFFEDKMLINRVKVVTLNNSEMEQYGIYNYGVVVINQKKIEEQRSQLIIQLGKGDKQKFFDSIINNVLTHAVLEPYEKILGSQGEITVGHRKISFNEASEFVSDAVSIITDYRHFTRIYQNIIVYSIMVEMYKKGLIQEIPNDNYGYSIFFGASILSTLIKSNDIPLSHALKQHEFVQDQLQGKNRPEDFLTKLHALTKSLFDSMDFNSTEKIKDRYLNHGQHIIKLIKEKAR